MDDGRQHSADLRLARGIAQAIGVPTDVIPNPVFGREIAPTWWSVPVLIITAILGGLLVGTYIRTGDADIVDSTDRKGGMAGLLSFFALGTLSARRWFEPIQPFLAATSITLMAYALRTRLQNPTTCPLPTR